MCPDVRNFRADRVHNQLDSFRSHVGMVKCIIRMLAPNELRVVRITRNWPHPIPRNYLGSMCVEKILTRLEYGNVHDAIMLCQKLTIMS